MKQNLDLIGSSVLDSNEFLCGGEADREASSDERPGEPMQGMLRDFRLTNEPDLRKIGLHPDFWYPVAVAKHLKKGKSLGVSFAGEPIVLVRTESNKIYALEDRCAHRQLKLSTGQVSGCNLICQYHGWAYDGEGKVAHVPHDLFGRQETERYLGNRIPFKKPDGGFFLWLDVGNGVEAALKLWREAGIRVLPGAYMGREIEPGKPETNPGFRYIRVALVQDLSTIQAALGRMGEILGGTT